MTKIRHVALAIERERGRWSMSRGQQTGAWLAMRRADSGALAVVESLPGPTVAARMRFDTLVSLACGRAAIGAMEVPTDAMLEAGMNLRLDSGLGVAEEMWAAMHATALKEDS